MVTMLVLITITDRGRAVAVLRGSSASKGLGR